MKNNLEDGSLMKNKMVNDSIVFLDIDGVINDFIDMWVDYKKELIDRLNKITDTCGASIVISSSQRLNGLPFEKKKARLINEGVTGNILAYTPLDVYDRFEAINAYIKRNNVSVYVILDDYPCDIPSLRGNQILTESEVGLTDENVIAAIAILRS